MGGGGGEVGEWEGVGEEVWESVRGGWRGQGASK